VVAFTSNVKAAMPPTWNMMRAPISLDFHGEFQPSSDGLLGRIDGEMWLDINTTDLAMRVIWLVVDLPYPSEK